MFSWLKGFLNAKEPGNNTKWVIKVNNKGEYFVFRKDVESFASMSASLYFGDKKFSNVQQCEEAIAAWEHEQWLKQKSVVKYV